MRVLPVHDSPASLAHSLVLSVTRSLPNPLNCLVAFRKSSCETLTDPSPPGVNHMDLESGSKMLGL